MDNPYQAPLDPPERTPDDGRPALASRWNRFFASLIDALLGAALLWTFILVVLGYRFAEVGKLGIGAQLRFALIGMVGFLALHGYHLVVNGQTLGKRMIGIRIATLDGAVPAFLPLILKRYLPVWVVSSIPFAGGLINLVNILFIFRDDRRCVHDLIAGTRVVDAAARRPSAESAAR